MDRIETAILSSLIYNDEYVRKVLPFLDPEYFKDPADRFIFETTYNFFTKYQKLPTVQAIGIEAQGNTNFSEEELKSVAERLLEIKQFDRNTNTDTWLVDNTEKFCQEKALYNAVSHSIQVMDGKDKDLTKDAIPKLLSDALAISFDPRVGHDYIEDSDERYEYYHRKEDKLEMHLEYFNKITKGGIPKKTLNIIMTPPYGGKTAFLCDMAANAFLIGKQVLYITMEMSEEMINKRIDANLLDITLNELESIPKTIFEQKIEKVKSKSIGKLITREYPSGSAHVGHFRHLLHELKLKKNFIPDIIFVDYLGICASSRLKRHGASTGEGYFYVKSIAEELRGLGQEFDVPIWTGVQFNREGATDSDPDMTKTAESWGIPATADFMIVFIRNEEMEKLNQVLVKQLKNRYDDAMVNRKFIIGFDKPKMRFYTVEQKAQEDISESGQDGVATNGMHVSPKIGGTKKLDKSKFSDIIV